MISAEDYCKQHLKKELAEVEKSGIKNEFRQLSVYEKTLIYKYSYDGYASVNKNLRFNNGKNNTGFGVLLEQALNELPSFTGIVYRGAYLTRKELKKYTDADKTNKHINEPSFVSTSQERLIAMGFNGNVLFRILSKNEKEIEKLSKFGIHNPPLRK